MPKRNSWIVWTALASVVVAFSLVATPLYYNLFSGWGHEIVLFETTDIDDDINAKGDTDFPILARILENRAGDLTEV